MKKLLAVLLFVSLTGCNWLLYRADVEQGNIVTPDMTSQLHIGMTPQQVRYVMGNPILTHSFDINRWDYLYTLRKSTNPTEVERLTLHFKNGQLAEISPVAKYQIVSS